MAAAWRVLCTKARQMGPGQPLSGLPRVSSKALPSQTVRRSLTVPLLAAPLLLPRLPQDRASGPRHVEVLDDSTGDEDSAAESSRRQSAASSARHPGRLPGSPPAPGLL